MADFSEQGSPAAAAQTGPDVYVLPLTEVSLPMAKQPGRSGEWGWGAEVSWLHLRLGGVGRCVEPLWDPGLRVALSIVPPPKGLLCSNWGRWPSNSLGLSTYLCSSQTPAPWYLTL